MSKVNRRSVKFADIDAVVAEAQRLLDQGYAKAGNWSLGQCCNHLALALGLTLKRYWLRLPPPFSTINRALFFGTDLAPALAGKIRLPTLPGFAQTEPVDDHEGVRRLIEAADRVKAAGDAELQPNPLMGKLTKDQWLRFHTIHAERHLGFLVPHHNPAGKQTSHNPSESSSPHQSRGATAEHA